TATVSVQGQAIRSDVNFLLIVVMGEQDTNFFMDNIVLIGVVGLAFFWYLLMLIRKRSRKGFLHDQKK
ncbi:MAG: hypothetical protein OEV30_12570, partial [Ignavibacteria bacterium]|nr:hypothetical protein [Ignavibacteria bacterium]